MYFENIQNNDLIKIQEDELSSSLLEKIYSNPKIIRTAGTIFVIDRENKLIGCITKGDYIRSLNNNENVNINKINDDLSYRMAKIIYNFSDTIKEAASKNEPYIISRYLIDLAKAYSSFYNENKILSDDLEERDSRLYLVNMVGNILKKGTYLLGIEMPNKM